MIEHWLTGTAFLFTLAGLCSVAHGGGAASAAPQPGTPEFITGIEPFQVFCRKGKSGDIPFVATGQGKLTATVTRDSDKTEVVRKDWDLGDTAATTRSLVIPGVPVGGEYTVRFDQGGKSCSFEHILVGDIWIVAGQSNAVGTMVEPEKPSPGVHYFRDGHWGDGADPLFRSFEPFPPGKVYVNAWRRAGQRYQERTGVPVGMMGWAFGGVPMSRFWDTTGTELVDLKGLVSKHGKGATAYLWYQGESDANRELLPKYSERLTAMAAAVRRYADNPRDADAGGSALVCGTLAGERDALPGPDGRGAASILPQGSARVARVGEALSARRYCAP